MDRVIKDGKVAVCYSPGFGAGWTTWCTGVTPFEPKVVEMILAGKQSEIDDDWCEKNLPHAKYCYTGGTLSLRIEWLPIGTRFAIEDYDGSERVVTIDQLPWEA